MKFSYRLTAVCLLIATVIVVFLTWGNDMIMWDDTSHLSTHKMKTPHTLAPLRQQASIKRLPEAPANAGSSSSTPGAPVEMCAFTERADAEADVDTFKILELIDQNKVKVNETFSDPAQIKAEAEGFQAFKSPNGLPLEVIVVPHSHSDPGWHKTVNSYFEDQTQHTLNNMVEKLTKYPKMTFIWAESVFLSLWWADLDEGTRRQVQGLAERGQLEIVVGSWVVPDEANTHFEALVDQMVEGHQWLERNLGMKPKNIWSLDPFGYSSTLPYLYHHAGFENMVILRVHEKVKAALQADRHLEFRWQQRWDARSDLMTLLMPYKLYNIKHSCGPDPQVCLQFDFRRIPGESSESRSVPITEENVEAKARLLLTEYTRKAALFRHNVLLVPIGDDFRFDRSIEWDQQYENYQRLFDYINSRSEWNVHARFGTVQTYFDELRHSLQLTNTSVERFFPSLSGDFFPYTDQNDDYWTGYFTTRPYLKVLSRELETHLRTAEVLHTLTPAKDAQRQRDLLTSARQDLALFQHHDGITGTSKAWVASDYEERLQYGLQAADEVARSSAATLLGLPHDRLRPRPILAWRGEEGPVHLTKGGIILVVFNPLGRARQDVVRLLVDADCVRVMDMQGQSVKSQINPVWTQRAQISSERFELVFLADLPPLAVVTFHIERADVGQPGSSALAYLRLVNHPGRSFKHRSRFQIRPPTHTAISLENSALRADFAPRTGLLKEVTTKPLAMTVRTELDFRMYKSRLSGAYLFSPTGLAVDSEMESSPRVRVVLGPVVSEVHVLQKLVNHTVRVYNSSGQLGQGIHVDNIVDIRSMDDKELVMHLQTDLDDSNGTFFADLNSFQTVRRKRWESGGLPPEARYAPFSSHAFLEDRRGRVSLAAAQPLGVSSQEPSALEVMLDRRLRYDDQRGMGEGVQDNRPTLSRFFLALERPRRGVLWEEGRAEVSSLVRMMAEELRHYSWQALLTSSGAKGLPKGNEELSLLPPGDSLPCGLQLVNLRALNDTSALLVLHRPAISCRFPSPSCPSEGQLKLGSLFRSFHPMRVTETSLSLMHDKRTLSGDFDVHFDPMELKAFRLTFG